MNKNLKTIVLALIAGLTITVCAEEPACAPKMDAPTPATAVAVADQAPAEKKAKPRRTRRAKKDKEMDTSEIPVTGMLDSAE